MARSTPSAAGWPDASRLLAELPRWLNLDLKGREDRVLVRLIRRLLRADALVVGVGSLESPGPWHQLARAGARAGRLGSELLALDPEFLRRLPLDRIAHERVGRVHARELEPSLRRCAQESILRIPLRGGLLGDRVLFLIDPPAAADSEIAACAHALELTLRGAAEQHRVHRYRAESTALRRENLVLTEARLAQQSELNRERALLRLTQHLERSGSTPTQLLRVGGRCLADPLQLGLLLLLRPGRGEIHALLPEGQPELPANSLMRSALLRNRLGAPEDFRVNVLRDAALLELQNDAVHGMATALSEEFEGGDRLLAISVRRSEFPIDEQDFLQRAATLLLRRLHGGERERGMLRHTRYLERRLDQLSASYRIARTLSESDDSESAAARILRDVRGAFGADAAILVQADDESLQAFASEAAEDASVLAFALANYEQRFGAPAEGRVRLHRVGDEGEEADARSVPFEPGELDGGRWPDAIVAPLRLPGGEAGVLCLCARTPDAFTAEAETALRVLAGDAAETLGHLHGRAVRERKVLEELVAQLPTAVLVVGAGGEIRVLNRAARSLLGVGERKLGRLRDLEKRVGLQFSLLLPAAGEAPQSSQDIVWGEEGARHLRIDVGTINEHDHVLVLRDVTRRKRLELEQAEFVGSVSHELKTPLTSLRTALEIILQGEAGQVSEEQAHFLQMGRRNIDRLGRLIQQLLDVARHESGRLELARARAPLTELLTPHIESFARHAKREARELHWGLDPEAVAAVDRDRFIEILENLLSNALKFTDRGGRIDVRLHAGTPCPDRSMQSLGRRMGVTLRGSLLEVEDDGRGMDPIAASRAFQRFYQAGDPLVDRPRGAGLGLAITRALVAAHEGTIELESQEGRGTCVRVWIPENAESGAVPSTFDRLGHAVGEAQSRLRRGRLVLLRENQGAEVVERCWKEQGLDPARLGASIAGQRFGLVLDDEWRAAVRRALAKVVELGPETPLPPRRAELGTLLARLIPAGAVESSAR